MRTGHGWREVLLIDLPLFMGTTFSVAMFYLVTQREAGEKRIGRILANIPLVLSLGIGLCVNQTRAVLEAIKGKPSEFVRTPKTGVVNRLQQWTKTKYRASLSWVPIVEIGLGIYFLITLIVAARGGHWLSVPFIFLFFLGFWYVGLVSLWHAIARRG